MYVTKHTIATKVYVFQELNHLQVCGLVFRGTNFSYTKRYFLTAYKNPSYPFH